jgi:hypothetical protein
MSGCEVVGCPYFTEERICCFPEDYCYYNQEKPAVPVENGTEKHTRMNK